MGVVPLHPRFASSLSRASLPSFSPTHSNSHHTSRHLRPAASMSAATPPDAPDAVETRVSASDGGGGGDTLVQYVVLRRDLIDTWPLGSVVTQGCHAAVAAIWGFSDHPDTATYCSPANIDKMHKVTLEVKGEIQMRNLQEKLREGGIDHKLWIEQPENIPTCIATRPYPRSSVASFFKKLKLCK